MDAAICGATLRLVPIFMTALVTALGLLHLAVQSGEPGNEIEGRVAVVIRSYYINAAESVCLADADVALRAVHAAIGKISLIQIPLKPFLFWPAQFVPQADEDRQRRSR
jgi:hypothetical protein